MLHKCPNGDWKSNQTYCIYVSEGTTGSFDDQINNLISEMKKRSKWMDDNVLGVYQELNGTVCGEVSQQGELPKYNCGPDTNDGGCLENPAQFYTAVPIPTIRPPYNGYDCEAPMSLSSKLVDTNVSIDDYLPSIDQCWLSVGGGVTTGLTHFVQAMVFAVEAKMLDVSVITQVMDTVVAYLKQPQMQKH